MLNIRKEIEPENSMTKEYATAESVSAVVDKDISTEIIAVIVAAIEAMLSRTSVNSGGLIIKKISRISGEKFTWSNAGLMECINSRRF